MAIEAAVVSGTVVSLAAALVVSAAAEAEEWRC